MSTYILKDNEQTGPYEDIAIRSALASGQFLYSDYGWREGMAEWKPLSALYTPPPKPFPAAATIPTSFKFCSSCGAQLAREAAICLKCGVPAVSQRPQSAQLGDNAAMRLLLPVGRSGWAIAAGYLGLFSLVVVPAPIALIVSIIAIKDISRSKSAEHPKHGMGRAIFGLVMGIIGTLVILFFLTSKI